MKKLREGKVLLRALKPFIKFPLELEEPFYDETSCLRLTRARWRLSSYGSTFSTAYRSVVQVESDGWE
ncbi:MAG: hypothetical protein ACOH5I_02645 [Oligoflexus sp.]